MIILLTTKNKGKWVKIHIRISIAFHTYYCIFDLHTKLHVESYLPCLCKNILFRINKCMTRISFKFNIRPPTMGKKRSSKSTIHYGLARYSKQAFHCSLHTYTSAHTLTWNYVKCRLWASDHPSHALFFSSTRSRLLQPYFSPIFVPVALSPPNHFHFSVFFYSTVFQAFELTVFRNTRVIYDSYCSHDY